MESIGAFFNCQLLRIGIYSVFKLFTGFIKAAFKLK
jgi:hypothetical protein